MNDDCPKCGGTVYVSRDTSGGHEIVRRICVKCGWVHITDNGVATWRVMQEFRRKLRGSHDSKCSK